MLATVDPGLSSPNPLTCLISRTRVTALLRPPVAVDGALPEQGADPDPTIRMDSYVPPAHSPRYDPNALLPKAVEAQSCTPKRGVFPQGSAWEINSANAAIWAGHRFEGHFSERVLRLIANPEGHPLFELRLDILQYEVLFARFVGVPHNPDSVRQELPPEAWSRSLAADQRRNKPAELAAPVVRCLSVERDAPELAPVPLQPQPWSPDCPQLLACLQASCRDYAAGLAMYLLPGREHWGAD